MPPDFNTGKYGWPIDEFQITSSAIFKMKKRPYNLPRGLGLALEWKAVYGLCSVGDDGIIWALLDEEVISVPHLSAQVLRQAGLSRDTNLQWIIRCYWYTTQSLCTMLIQILNKGTKNTRRNKSGKVIEMSFLFPVHPTGFMYNKLSAKKHAKVWPTSAPADLYCGCKSTAMKTLWHFELKMTVIFICVRGVLPLETILDNCRDSKSDSFLVNPCG